MGSVLFADPEKGIFQFFGGVSLNGQTRSALWKVKNLSG
jgi:hypothetical protein